MKVYEEERVNDLPEGGGIIIGVAIALIFWAAVIWWVL